MFCVTQKCGIISVDKRSLHLHTALKIKICVTCSQEVRKKEVEREGKSKKKSRWH